MNLLVCGAVVAGLVLGILLALFYKYTETGRRTMAKYNSPEYQEWFDSSNPDFNPDTGEWEDWDGTPYGAIEDLLMDTDGDGVWDDFDGDGIPDYRD